MIAEYDRLETELQRVLIDKAFLEEQLRQANKSIDLLSRSNALNSDSEASESTQEEKRSPGYKSLLSMLEVTKTNLSEVTKELETEKLRADSLHNEVLFMRRSVEEDRKEKLVLHAVLVEKDTLYFSLEDENKKREQSLLTEYEAIIKQKEAQLADLTQELTNKVSELASLTMVVEEDREKIIMLRSEMAAAIKTTKLHQKESGDLREQLQHTTSLLDVEKKRAIKENTTMAALNARLESEMKAKDAALATAQGLKLKEIQLQNALSAAEASIVELHASLMAAGDRETSLSSLLADLTAEASSLRLLVQSNFKDEMKTDLAGKEESGKDSITEKNHGEDLELEQEKEKVQFSLPIFIQLLVLRFVFQRNHAPGPSMSQPATEVLKKGNSPFANKIGTPTTVMDEIETELAHGDDDNADNVSKIIGTFIADPTAVSAKNSKLKWIKRLIKEKALIDAAKSELDRETADLRSRQLKLLKVKELWKKQNEGNQSKRRGNENREQIVLINAKAAALNNRIETAKRVRRWIEERQKKLVLLERGMLAEDVDQENLDDDASVGSHARGNGLLKRLIKELDDDVSALESVVSSTPSTATPLSSERYRPRQASHRKYRSHSGPGPYAPPGYSRILYAHPPLYPPSLFYETMPETRGFFGVKPPIPQGILFNDEISGAFTTHNKRHHYKHGHWTAPIMAESEVSQEGYIGAASVPTAAENRRQLQEITNRMKASKEAYEGHAK